MTDWERVEKLRSRGLSWSEIAEDEKVGFKAPAGTEKPGLALKALYFQRRSRRERRASRGQESDERGRKTGEGGSKHVAWRDRHVLIASVGIVIALAAAVPFLLGYAVTLIPTAIPLLYLAIAAGVGLVVLGLGLVLGSTGALEKWKRAVILGIVVGLLFAFTIVAVEIGAGCPNLATGTVSEPSPNVAGESGGTWVGASNSLWTENGMPVVFFFGSIECPYCSASSWAIRDAMEAFSAGSFSPVVYHTSITGDVYPSTPEVELAGTSSGGSTLSWDPQEDTNTAAIGAPTVGCPESAYTGAYDGQGSIPFVVVGGVFIHQGTFVNPACLSSDGCNASDPYTTSAFTPEQVEGDLSSHSGADYTAIWLATYYLEAYMWKADSMAGITPPASVMNNAEVAGVESAISTP